MNKRVEIFKQQEIFKRAIFQISEAQLRHELYSGEMSEPITRLKLDRGDSVAMLVHDAEANTVLLTEQFRFPTYRMADSDNPGWLVEIPAGILRSDEAPEDAVRREILEEIGYSPTTIEHISTFYLSPGGSSERIMLYYARVTAQQQTNPGGGVLSEGEDIRIIAMSLAEAFDKISNGQINDAKTIIALQWLQLRDRA